MEAYGTKMGLNEVEGKSEVWESLEKEGWERYVKEANWKVSQEWDG